MPVVAVDLIRDEALVNDELIDLLTEHGLGGRLDDSARVEPVRINDCNRLGAIVASVVINNSSEYKLHVKGPGGETMLHRFRGPDVADTIARFVATCAGFQ